MGLNNNKSKIEHIRLGDYITQSTQNNKDLKYSADSIEGINTSGGFMSPKGNPTSVDLLPYKIVGPGAFVYNTTRLDSGSIAYRTEGTCIVSHHYIVFYLNDSGREKIDPLWLYMYFRREEFRREVIFRNFGSARAEFSFYNMSDVAIPLPALPVQKKYVAIYQAMVANQQSYERGLDDIKLSMDSLLDRIKHKSNMKPMGELLEEIDCRNDDGNISDVQGINITKQFMPSVADTNGVNLKNYKVVKRGQFAYSGMQTGRDECIRIALYDRDDPIIISPAYSVFEVKDSSVLPQYIMMWFSRAESDRRGWFMSDSSIRTNLDLDRFYEIKLPVPDIAMQKSIVELYAAYVTRRNISEKLKAQIRDICPILIKGSIEDGKSKGEVIQ